MLDVIHIRTWIYLTQHSIDVERIGIESKIKPLREHNLEYVASFDVLLRGQDRPLIGVAILRWIKF